MYHHQNPLQKRCSHCHLISHTCGYHFFTSRKLFCKILHSVFASLKSYCSIRHSLLHTLFPALHSLFPALHSLCPAQKSFCSICQSSLQNETPRLPVLLLVPC